MSVKNATALIYPFKDKNAIYNKIYANISNPLNIFVTLKDYV